MKTLSILVLTAALVLSALYLSAAGRTSAESATTTAATSSNDILTKETPAENAPTTAIQANVAKATARPADASMTTATSADDPATSTRADDVALSDRSVFHLESTWKTQESDDVEWSSLRGRPLLVAMFYTHCGFTCPRIVHDLKGLLSELPRNERRTVGVVLVSIDPEHDTPEALKAFSERHGLDTPQWTFLTGSDEDVREIAAVLNIRYQQQPGGDIAHSNTITLLDHGGEIVAQRGGFNSGGDGLAAELSRLASDDHSTDYIQP